MEAITPLHNLNPPLLQNSLPNKRPRSHSTIFSLLRVSETQLSVSIPSSSSSFDSLNGYVEIGSLNSAKIMHAQMTKKSRDENSDAKMQSLITSYLIFGEFRSAAMVFFLGLAQNYVHWNAFQEEFECFGGDPFEILEVFCELHNKGVSFDSRILTIILKISANLTEVWLGVEVHAGLIKRGFDIDVYLKCALMNFYGRCWGIDYANQVFYEMPEQKALLWSEAVLVQLRNERWLDALQFFRDMQFSSVKANSFTLAKVLQACGNVKALDEGKQIHGHVVRCALEPNVSVCNSLVSLYSRNKSIQFARGVFDLIEHPNLSSWNSIIYCYSALGHQNEALELFYKMEACNMKPNIVTWNSLLSGHFLNGLHQEVITIFRRMQAAGLKPNSSSITSVLQAISELTLLNLGKEIHGYVIRNGLHSDVYIGTSLVDMYLKNDNLPYARAVFDGMTNRNVFAWNSLISGYSFKGQFEDAINLLYRMEGEGIRPDTVTYNGLISGYSKWGHNEEALALIRQIKTSGLIPDVVMWNALISGCAQSGNYEDAVRNFIQMQEEGIRPNSASIASLLRACAGLSSLQKGKEIHCMGIRNGFSEDVFVCTSLIDMYSKCGSLNSAYQVFQKSRNKTLASWNCMIMSFANYSRGKEAISVFDEMREAGFQPDDITFIAVLSGCKHSGLLDEGWKYFDSMKADYNVIPKIEHYSCMVDLLARAGYLDEAWDFIKTMPMVPDAGVWGAILGSRRIHENLDLAEIAAKNLFKLEPHNTANYVLMMNLYATLNRWEDVERIKELAMVTGVKFGQAWSSIQINHTVHLFRNRGESHPDEGEIYFELYQIISEMKNVGYQPDIRCVYQNIDRAEKEKVLLTHTEKLAITYGLLKLRNGEPIRVITNTGVCSDCHTAAKYISLLRGCEILLKDGVRFHHFREGRCSCNDSWL